MSATFAEIINSGHGRIEFVWHCGGATWAVSTSSGFVSNLTTYQRRLMFGMQMAIGGSPPTYYAELVDIYPILQPPGKWTVSLKDGEGTLDGGTWTAEIADVHCVPTLWTLNKRDIYGLEGLQAVATPRNDDALGYASLYDDLTKTSTQIHIIDDWGDTIKDAVDAANTAGEPYVVWIGNLAVGVTGTTAATDGVKLDIDTLENALGILRTAPQSFFPTANGPDIPVCNTMLGGIQGRPWYLWAFAVDQSDTILDGPALVHHGKIGTRIQQRRGGSWQVQCLPWWAHLDTDITIERVTASLDRYVFSRGPSSSNHPPHMQIREYDGSAWSATTDIYLCAADSTVMYRDVDELLDDLLSAVNTASPNGWNYSMSGGGPHYASGTSYAQIRGALVGLFGFGKHSDYGDPIPEWGDIVDAMINHRNYADPWQHPWWATWFNTLQWSTTLSPPDYVYQWYWHEDTDYDDDDPAESPTNKFVVPVDPTSGNPTIWIKQDTADVSVLATDDELLIGNEEFDMQVGYDNFLKTISKIGISAVGGGPDAGEDENYIEIDSSPNWSPGDHECIIGVLEQDADSENDDKKFLKGGYLYYNTDLHSSDPWAIEQNFDATASKLSDIFLALCGDSTGITIPEYIQTDHIPDMRELADQNMHETIDWDTIDALVGLQASQISGVYFKFRFAGSHNLKDLLTHELRFWGLTPFWYYDDIKDMYRLSARMVGQVNTTAAVLSGRALDTSSIASGTMPEVEKSGEPIYNAIDLQLNYDGTTGKYNTKMLIAGDTSATGGRTVKVSCKPRITHVDLSIDGAIEDLTRHFIQLIAGTQIPNENQTVSASVRDLIAQGVGLDVLVSHDAPHNPADGDVGLTERPAVITSMTVDYSRSKVSYKYRLGPTRSYGWAPTCIITTCHIDGDEVHVTDVGGSGQAFTGFPPYVGWMDYWFFDDLAYNGTMSAPEDQGCCDDYAVKLIEIGSSTPTVYTGLRVKDVTTDDYSASPTEFFKVYGAAGWNASFDVNKDYYMVFDDYDATNIQSCQKRYVYQADTSGEIVSGTPGDRWKT